MPRTTSIVVGTARFGQLLSRTLTDPVGLVDSRTQQAGDGSAQFPTAAGQVGSISGGTSHPQIQAENGEVFNLTNRIIGGNVFANKGSSVTLTDCTINGGVVCIPQAGQPAPTLVLTRCRITNGLSINPLDAAGSTLYWGGTVPVTMNFTRCWIYHPVAFQPAHVEALAGFGFASGGRYTSCSFVQQGAPGVADGVTGVTNFYGHNTIFDDCLFGWDQGPAAPFCLYMRPENAGGHTNGGTTISDCAIQKGAGMYVYNQNASEGYSHALYTGCYDYDTGVPLTLPD